MNDSRKHICIGNRYAIKLLVLILGVSIVLVSNCAVHYSLASATEDTSANTTTSSAQSDNSDKSAATSVVEPPNGNHDTTSENGSNFVEVDPKDAMADGFSIVPSYYNKLDVLDEHHLVASESIAVDQHYRLFFYTVDGARVYRVYGLVDGANLGFYSYNAATDSVDTSSVLNQDQEEYNAQLENTDTSLNLDEEDTSSNLNSDSSPSLNNVSQPSIDSTLLSDPVSASAVDQALLLNDTSATQAKIINGTFDAFPAAAISENNCTWAEISRVANFYYLHTSTMLKTGKLTQAQLNDFAWYTTESLGNGWVEIQKESDSSNVYGELCASMAGTAIYQDISSTPGSVLKWKLKHSSRISSYTDGMSVLIGAPGAETAQLARRTSSNGVAMNANVTNGDKNQVNWENQIIYTPNNRPTTAKPFLPDWESYEGTYEVPEGQSTTRFTFKSVASYSGGIGNYLDDIEFAQAWPLWYKSNGGRKASGTEGDTVDDSGAPYTGKRSSNSVYANYFLEATNQTLATAAQDSGTGDTWDSSMMEYPTDTNGREYVFLGWSKKQQAPLTSKAQLDNSDIVTSYTSVSTSLENNVVYAVWGAKPKATFHSQTADVTSPASQNNIDWEGHVTSPSSWSIGSTSIRPGYTFNGWFTDAAYAQAYDFADSAYSDVDLYAKWTARSYDVHFDAHGGTGSMDNQLFTYGVQQALTSNSFARAGYVFAGWNTVADGSGTAYTDAQSVLNLLESGTLTLYAQWFAAADLYKTDAQSVTMTSYVAHASFGSASSANVLIGSSYNNASAFKRDKPTDTWGSASFTQSIDPEDWKKIQAGEVGVYQVIYTNADDTVTPHVSRHVAVTIIPDTAAASTDQLFRVDAQPVTLNASAAKDAFAQATDATSLMAETYNNAGSYQRAHAIDAWGEKTSATQSIAVP